MAQEQEYKHPNVCVPTPHLSRTAGQQQEEGPPTAPEEGLALGTCLPWPHFMLSSVPNRSVLTFLPPTETYSASVTGEVLRMFLGRRIREDRNERVNKGPHQARLGTIPGDWPAPFIPSFLGSEGRKESWCLQGNGALRNSCSTQQVGSPEYSH